MTRSDLYRRSFEHEIDANASMLQMLAGVPESVRTDSRFQRAVNIAAHMCACRRNYIEVFAENDQMVEPWFEEHADFDQLASRFKAMEAAWTNLLSSLDDSRLDQFFTFVDNGQRWKMSLEAQIFQLQGHAAYHRGQVVLLVDQLGGATVDTDYIYWFERAVPGGCGPADD